MKTTQLNTSSAPKDAATELANFIMKSDLLPGLLTTMQVGFPHILAHASGGISGEHLAAYYQVLHFMQKLPENL